MVTIRDLARSHGLVTTLSPGWAVTVWIVATSVAAALNRMPQREADAPLALHLAVALVYGVLIAWAQATMNRTWWVARGGSLPFHVHPFEWMILVVGGGIVGLAILSSLVGAP
jgi:hypothetical protein